MSRRHDSRDRDVQRRRRDADDTINDRDGRNKRDQRNQQRPASSSSSSATLSRQHHGSSSNSSSRNDRHHNNNNQDNHQRRERHDDRYSNREQDSVHRGGAIKREHQHSRSPDTKAKRHRNRYANEDVDNGQHEWGKSSDKAAAVKGEPSSAAAATDEAAGPIEKEQPNFGLSGKLTEDTNKVNGIVLKYSEPDEARKPKRRWRLYPFKGTEALPTLFIHRQSCFLIGRDRKICDIPVDHPSCSKQHAVLQYRLVGYQRDDGTKGKRVRPYVLDLESANGTYLNNQRIDSKKYIEVLEKDVIKFGYSSREYVMLHENSKDEEEDDDVLEEVEPVTATAK